MSAGRRPQRILITGISGLLGRAVARASLARGWATAGWWHAHFYEQESVHTKSVDLTQKSSIAKGLEEWRPDVVVHCAALTAVDECERNPALCTKLNVTAVRDLAQLCDQLAIRLLVISTDSVFDGQKGGYAENSPPSPINAYAHAKLQGEYEALAACPSALIARTTFFGVKGNGASLAEWILGKLERAENVPAFEDVHFSPLYVDDLGDVLGEIAERDLQGLYHVTASDGISKYEFARQLALAFGYDPGLVKRARLADAKLTAPRPLDTTLKNTRLAAALGHPLPTVAAGIARFRSAHPAFLSAAVSS